MRSLILMACLAVLVGCNDGPSTKEVDATPAAGSGDKPGSGSAAKTSADATPALFNLVGAPVVEYEAPKMHCEACEAGVRKALLAEVGVIDVKADSETKIVRVAIDESTYDEEAAIGAIANAGFGEAVLRETAGE